LGHAKGLELDWLKQVVEAADTSDVISIRGVFAAFFGAFAWYVWTVEHQTRSACYSGSHYLPSVAIALAVIVGLVVASRRPWQRPSVPTLLREAVTTALLTVIALLAAGFFAAVVSCSGG
jgi:hypothetical protein